MTPEISISAVIEEGFVYAPEGVGLSTALLPKVLKRDDLTVRTSVLQ